MRQRAAVGVRAVREYEDAQRGRRVLEAGAEGDELGAGLEDRVEEARVALGLGGVHLGLEVTGSGSTRIQLTTGLQWVPGSTSTADSKKGVSGCTTLTALPKVTNPISLA